MVTETRTMKRWSALAPVMMLACAGATADDNRGPRRAPPPEAFEACAEKVQGDVCGFTGRRGTVEGMCEIPRGGEDGLVCAPEHRRGGPDRPPADDPNDGADTEDDQE